MTQEQQDKLRRALYNAKFTTDAEDENPFVGVYFQDLLGIIANYDNNPHWISVEDELPTITINDWRSENLLFVTDDGLERYGFYRDGGVWFSSVRGFSPKRVTHWMPLPQPPRKENKT